MKQKIEKLIKKYSKKAETALQNSKEYDDFMMRSQFSQEHNHYMEIVKDLQKLKD